MGIIKAINPATGIVEHIGEGSLKHRPELRRLTAEEEGTLKNPPRPKAQPATAKKAEPAGGSEEGKASVQELIKAIKGCETAEAVNALIEGENRTQVLDAVSKQKERLATKVPAGNGAAPKGEKTTTKAKAAAAAK